MAPAFSPAAGVAAAARRIGLRTQEIFFGADTAPQLVQRYGRADLIAAHDPPISGQSRCASR